LPNELDDVTPIAGELFNIAFDLSIWGFGLLIALARFQILIGN
jgi:hypothetical protein